MSKSRSSEKPLVRAEIDILRQKVVDLIVQKPEKAATILSLWLKQLPSRSSHGKKAG